MERSDLIAIGAAVISLVSLGISYFGYNLQKEATELSVLPAISIYNRYEVPLRDSGTNEKVTTLQWKIENTGQGPGFIHSSVIVIDGEARYTMESTEGWEEIKKKLSQILETEDLVAFDNDPISCPYAVKAGSEWPLFSISYRGDLTTKLKNISGIDLAICYCSLHGECFYEGTSNKLLSCPTDDVDPQQLLRGNSCGF